LGKKLFENYKIAINKEDYGSFLLALYDDSFLSLIKSGIARIAPYLKPLIK